MAAKPIRDKVKFESNYASMGRAHKHHKQGIKSDLEEQFLDYATYYSTPNGLEILEELSRDRDLEIEKECKKI